ncbi:hypothetical protein Lal_00037979 [Lupinus albus]|nr:hypothetical protein Lal_00037979 [Lupinus albus]
MIPKSSKFPSFGGPTQLGPPILTPLWYGVVVVPANQERLKPQQEKAEKDRSKVDDLRGSPMSVGNLEELIDENHAIVSSLVEPEYYVWILSFVDKVQLESSCSILMHNKVLRY